jgi:hypothetical protein
LATMLSSSCHLGKCSLEISDPSCHGEVKYSHQFSKVVQSTRLCETPIVRLWNLLPICILDHSYPLAWNTADRQCRIDFAEVGFRCGQVAHVIQPESCHLIRHKITHIHIIGKSVPSPTLPLSKVIKPLHTRSLSCLDS